MAKATKGTELAKAPTTTLDRIREKQVDIRTLSYDDIVKAMQEEDDYVDVSDLGDGFKLVQGIAGKKKLCGIPFVITDYKVRQKSTKVPGSHFGTMHIKTVAGDALIVNDGSTGIYAQLLDFAAKGIFKGIVCKKGLRVSEDYEVKDDNGDTVINTATGKPILGTTFYLDMSA